MTIAFACPQCAKTLRVNSELVGKRGKCPHCQTVLTIPNGSPAAAPETKPATPAKPAKVAMSASDDEVAGVSALQARSAQAANRGPSSDSLPADPQARLQ